MSSSLLGHQARLEIPGQWPESLHPSELAKIDEPTPFLVCDPRVIQQRYGDFSHELPDVKTFYAVKCNSCPEILELLAGMGSSFEVASLAELEALLAIGVDASNVLYSNPVKPPRHVESAYEAGLWRFAFDSEGELYKIAKRAPGAAVFIRLRVDDSASIFPLSRKFGAEAHDARALMLLARNLGLRPYGVTFHVGSQCGSPNAFRQAIASAGRLMGQLQNDGVEIEMLDIGGGFPGRYADPVPSIDQIGRAVMPALNELLPYRPELIAAEPGRYLVAESSVLVTGVLAREVRAGENWIYLDVGAYNGMMETQQTVNQWRFPLWTSRPDHSSVAHLPFTLTGPSCDSTDTMVYGAMLPSTLGVDDRVFMGSAGAYTLSYASNFNGFPPPTPLFL